MKAFLVFAFLIAAVCADSKKETYSDKFDYVNIKDILENTRLRSQYWKCFMDTAPCLTQDAKFFKCKFTLFYAFLFTFYSQFKETRLHKASLLIFFYLH